MLKWNKGFVFAGKIASSLLEHKSLCSRKMQFLLACFPPMNILGMNSFNAMLSMWQKMGSTKQWGIALKNWLLNLLNADISSKKLNQLKYQTTILSFLFSRSFSPLGPDLQRNGWMGPNDSNQHPITQWDLKNVGFADNKSKKAGNVDNQGLHHILYLTVYFKACTSVWKKWIQKEHPWRDANIKK